MFKLMLMKEKKPTQKAITKKEIRSKIQDSMNQVIGHFEKEGPSKRVKKVVRKASKKIASNIKRDLNKVKAKKSKGNKKLNGEKIQATAIA